MQKQASHIKKSIPFILVGFTVLIQYVFKKNPNIAESIYSTILYPVIAVVISSISSLFPFSLDDVFYISLVLVFIVSLTLVLIKKVNFFKFSLKTLQTIALVYVSFYWLWGFNYYRQTAHNRLNIEQSEANDSTFAEVFNLVIEQANRTYSPIDSFNIENFDTVIEDSYENMSNFLKIKYPSGQRRVKHITFSNFFAKATILGYFGPFFNEIHINKHLTNWDLPVVLAHEKSHQLGVTSEAEAGFYGWLVCTESEDKFIQYSGWLYALDYFIHQSKDLANRKELIKKIKPEVIEDIKAQNKHWRNWRDEKIDRATTKVNDAYLKSNNVKKGIKDYNGVVQLIVDYLQFNN